MLQVGMTKDQGLYNKPSAAVHPGALAAETLLHTYRSCDSSEQKISYRLDGQQIAGRLPVKAEISLSCTAKRGPMVPTLHLIRSKPTVR